MRNLVTILLVGFAAIAIAKEEPQQYWRVHPDEQACAAINHIDLSYLTTNYENPDPIGSVYLIINIPNTYFSSYEVNLLKPEDPRIFISIQPGGLFLKENIVTNLKMVTKSKAYDIPFDEQWSHQGDPRFLVVGLAAKEIWDQIATKKKVTVEFDLSTGKHYSIDGKGMFMDRIARMFAACSS